LRGCASRASIEAHTAAGAGADATPSGIGGTTSIRRGRIPCSATSASRCASVATIARTGRICSGP
jgi:hypothetical protein